MAAVDVVEAYLAEVPELGGRRLAHAEWGLTVPGERLAGERLDVGLTVADGLLSAKAPVLPAADGVDPWLLLSGGTARPATCASAARRAASCGYMPTCRRPGWTRRRSTGCWDWWSKRRWQCGGSP